MDEGEDELRSTPERERDAPHGNGNKRRRLSPAPVSLPDAADTASSTMIRLKLGESRSSTPTLGGLHQRPLLAKKSKLAQAVVRAKQGGSDAESEDELMLE